MTAYVDLFGTARVVPLLLATIASRLPVGVNPLAMVLLVHGLSGSFATAGVVAGAMTVGTAAGQPLLGRLVDVRGNAVMLPLAVGQVASIAGLLVAGHAGAATAILMLFALFNGFTLAPTTSVLRASWPRLLEARSDLLTSAYAVDSTLVQLSFLSGPLLVTALAALASPDAALALSAAAGCSGTVAFVAAAPRARARSRRRRGLLGPLREPAIRTLVVSQLPVGYAFGSMQLILPAFATDEGHAGQAGFLLALLSLASIAGALVYGSRTRRRPVHELHVRLATLVPLGFVPLLAAWSIPSMALLVLPAGSLLSVFFATRNELAGALGPPGSATEAVTWPLTAMIAGNAIGVAVAGAVAEGGGWRTASAISVLVAVLGGVVVHAARATLVHDAHQGAPAAPEASAARTAG